MKTNKRRTKKILAAIVAFLLIGLIFLTANGFMGNPISKILVNRAAGKYVDENYSNLELEAKDAFYNFKDGNYIVEVKSNKSIDTYFDLNFTPGGKLYYDNYEDAVLSGWNTRLRIDDEYRKLVDEVFEDSFPYKGEILYGELITREEDFSYLELDRKYDVKELAKMEGKLTLDMESEDRDLDMAAKVLVDTKKIFDEKDLPFNLIDLTLEKPREENEEYKLGLMIRDFKYEDIYPEGLEERLEKNIEETRKFYEENNEKQDEIEEYQKDSGGKD